MTNEIAPEQQFDFWLGEWDVAWEGGRGTNLIRRILDDKVIEENFDGRPGENLIGRSVSVYQPARGWLQTWVDNQGSYLDFTGGWEDGRMILARAAVVQGQPCRQRMVWYHLAADEFDWNWERSDDAGATWRVLWKIHYQRRRA
jgi:hypothetical protein